MSGIRTVPLVVVLAGLAVAAAGCGGSSPGSSGTTAASGQPAGAVGSSSVEVRQLALLRYATCMRAHGVPSFPDPRDGSLIVPAGVGPSSAQFRSANEACQGLLPDGGAAAQVTSPQNLQGLVKFAACMTKRGIPMSASANGSVSFPSNVDPSSPRFQSADHACEGLVPQGLP